MGYREKVDARTCSRPLLRPIRQAHGFFVVPGSCLLLVLATPCASAQVLAGSTADVNGDGRLDLGDPISLLSYLFTNGPSPAPCRICWYGSLPRGDANADGWMDLGDAVSILNYLFASGPAPAACPDCYPCRPCRLPATGARKCWDPTKGEFGGEVPCNNTEWPGQDAFYQTGCPAEGRFVDNADGTVSDTCTGLMWEKDTPMPPSAYDPDQGGRIQWPMALRYCEDLELAGYDDWRLPNVLELATLIDNWTRSEDRWPGPYGVNPVFRDRSLPDEEDLSIGSWTYWASTFVQLGILAYRYVDFQDPAIGWEAFDQRWLRYHVRAVRGGRDGLCSSCLPATGADTCYHPGTSLEDPPRVIPCENEELPGQDGFYRAGRPLQGRFFDNRDGTVTDLATGLMWLAETPVPGPAYEPDAEGRVNWQNGLLFSQDLEFAGYDDWRLPNVVEIMSIMVLSTPFLEEGPIRLRLSSYWSSTGNGTGNAAIIVARGLSASGLGARPHENMRFVHPVRGGF
ncbi:MAG: DUF1566 domain-containing protein [Planctomycetes bacterium]|nr:DUF1566 domain-containing protein [Planctomycetota bacterium]